MDYTMQLNHRPIRPKAFPSARQLRPGQGDLKGGCNRLCFQPTVRHLQVFQIVEQPCPPAQLAAGFLSLHGCLGVWGTWLTVQHWAVPKLPN